MAEEKIDHDLMALMFVRALILDTDPIENKLHNNRPCPIVIWEDSYGIENDSLKGHHALTQICNTENSENRLRK